MNLQEGALHVHEVTGLLAALGRLGKDGHNRLYPLHGRAYGRAPPMRSFKQLIRVAAATIIATGIFAGAVSPADAAAAHHHHVVIVTPMGDTGWGP